MFKHILLFCFFISIISSCKCNKDGKPVTDSTVTSSTTMESTTTDGTGAANKANDSMAAAAANSSASTTGTDQGNGKNLFKKGKGEGRNASNTKGYFPEGSERQLTDRDLEYLSAWGFDVMKNEIYARHGMIFPAGPLKDHFEKQPWYHAASSNVRGKLSSVEKSNLSFIENYKDKPAPEAGAY